jgi:nodulation protein E
LAEVTLAEGAAVAVLEDLDHARARGAPVLGEILGFGMTADAGDLLAPTLDGPLAAVRAALADAGLAPEDIDHINAHGSGTVLNDAIETKVIRAAFGAYADRISVSATKSMHGHALGATGAIELIAVLGALREGIVPPTINHLGPDPDCDLDVTPNAPRRRALRAALSNAFAFGGLNAVLAVGPSPDP